MTGADVPAAPSGHVVLEDEAQVERWCEYLGTTPQALEEAVLAVGDDPAAVREHLLNQGGSAGVG